VEGIEIPGCTCESAEEEEEEKEWRRQMNRNSS
jgi:hypothetical protein